jgi:hypothetical protein
MAELFWAIDEEGDPTITKLYLIKREDRWSHATFDFERCDDQPEFSSGVIRVAMGGGKVDVNSGKRKRLHWPKNIVRDAYRYMGYRTDAHEAKTMTGSQISEMPAEPTTVYEVKEIRSMESFCGVYFAFNEDGSCHYVGEAEDVTGRVRQSREEIGSRKIGFIRCELHERKRIEAYFVAMLDPPGNGISTHRMLKSAEEKKAKKKARMLQRIEEKKAKSTDVNVGQNPLQETQAVL